MFLCFFFFKQKTAYELRISDWSSDVCSSDLSEPPPKRPRRSSPKPQLQRRSHDRRLRSGKPNTYRTAIRRRRGRLGNAVASLLRPPTIAAGAVNGRWPPPQPAPQPAYLRVGGRSAGP